MPKGDGYFLDKLHDKHVRKFRSGEGRWPSNVVLGHAEECGEKCVPECPISLLTAQSQSQRLNVKKDEDLTRFFYCAKPSTSEREAGLPHNKGDRANVHPTVKPIGLMRYLIRLVTPPGGTVLDPFGGSGTTGCAAAIENFDAILIEQDSQYASIAQARIDHWKRVGDQVPPQRKKKVDRDTHDHLTVGSLESERKVVTEPETVPSYIFDSKGDDEMAQLPDSWLQETVRAKTAGGGTWIQHGDYTFLITKFFFQKVQDECVIVEFLVVESKKKIVFENGKPVEQEPNAQGSECSEVINFSGPGKLSAPGNLRSVVLGLFGFKEGEVDDRTMSETLRYIINDNTPAAGMLLKCSTFAKEKRSAKGEFITGREWSCVSKPSTGLNADAFVKARLAALAHGSDEAVRVTLEQLRQFRTDGAAQASAPSPAIAAPAAIQVVAAPPPPPAPPIVVEKAYLAGWTQHPQNPLYFYKGDQVKTESEIAALAGR